jgi:hypothetical protein
MGAMMPRTALRTTLASQKHMHRLRSVLDRLPPEIAEQIAPMPDPDETWRTCERADLLLWLALAAGVDREVVVIAAADLAEEAMRTIGQYDGAAMRAVRAWLEKRGSSNAAWAAGFALTQTAKTDGSPSSAALRAAACTAFACDERADATFYIHAGYAAHAAAHAMHVVPPKLASDIVRARIPPAFLIAALDRAGTIPPSAPDAEHFERTDSFYA